MSELRRGFWEKGMKEFMAVDGTIYKVNPENGIYKAKEVDKGGNVRYVSRLAGSCKPDFEQFKVFEDLGNGKEKVTTKDKNGRIYSTEIRTKTR